MITFRIAFPISGIVCNKFAIKKKPESCACFRTSEVFVMQLSELSDALYVCRDLGYVGNVDLAVLIDICTGESIGVKGF